MLISEEGLQARVAEIAQRVSADYAGRELLVIGVLKGAVFFIADLVRQLDVPCELDFMAVSSYGSSTHSSGVVRILKDLDIPIAGRHVLVVEDVIDSGLTLSYLMKNLRLARAGVARDLRPPHQARATGGWPSRSATSASSSPTSSSSGTASTTRERYRNLPYIAALELEAGQRPKDCAAVPGCISSRYSVLDPHNIPDIAGDLRPCLAGDSLGNCIRTNDSGH